MKDHSHIPNRRSARPLATVAALSALLAAPKLLHAETVNTDRFSISIAHLAVGEMVVVTRMNGDRYHARMSLRTSGILGLFRQAGFVGDTSGTLRIDGNGIAKFRPLEHHEDVDTGRHAGRASVRFSGPRPVTVQAEPASSAAAAGPVDPPPGSVDPVTLVLAVLRAPRDAQLCKFSADVFDGLRLSRAKIGAPRPDPSPDTEGSRILCDGTYTRVAGFSPAEMAERQEFRFVLRYRLDPSGSAHLDGVELDTLYGKGRLKRR